MNNQSLEMENTMSNNSFMNAQQLQGLPAGATIIVLNSPIDPNTYQVTLPTSPSAASTATTGADGGAGGHQHVVSMPMPIHSVASNSDMFSSVHGQHVHASTAMAGNDKRNSGSLLRNNMLVQQQLGISNDARQSLIFVQQPGGGLIAANQLNLAELQKKGLLQYEQGICMFYMHFFCFGKRCVCVCGFVFNVFFFSFGAYTKNVVCLI